MGRVSRVSPVQTATRNCTRDGGGSRVNLLCAFSRARVGGPLGQRFRSGGAGSELSGSYRVGSGTTRSKPLAEGVCGACALWHFRLGDRALDPWVCGRRTARGERAADLKRALYDATVDPQSGPRGGRRQWAGNVSHQGGDLFRRGKSLDKRGRANFLKELLLKLLE